MSMASQDNQKTNRLLKSFSFAIHGIGSAIQTERNMRIHLGSTVLVIVLSVFFSISKTEWLFILIAISGMFALELVNTAIERVVDLITEDYHPLAKQAKDIAAGAVFIYALVSVAIGAIIFWPYFLQIIRKIFA
ncbi:diacylglycerol kinase family protein [Bacillus sp. MRMR6]|uniref:diacylglycerol kinase family protein n=1 Tax=Bacillus sp. MRMR6 TaxID=1928617 RepID=UPI0009536144|nr:diacylglycerol kinase family protein [Bacillus sp. MRMR6]OLS41650.1 diacylglycerol kinase [Bacillus sp. MRMR6]